MTPPKYADIIGDERYKAAPYDKRVSVTNDYWDAYEKETGDVEYAKGQRELALRRIDLKDEIERADPVQSRVLSAEADEVSFALGATEAIRRGELDQAGYQKALASHKERRSQNKAKLDEIKPFFEQSKRKSEVRTAMVGEFEKSGLFGSVTAAAGGAADKQIRLLPNGDWDIPELHKNTGNVVLDTIGGAFTNLRQKSGSRMQDVKDLVGGAEAISETQDVFKKIQESTGASEEEMKAAWMDIGNSYRKMEKGEKARVLSDGTIVPNYNDSDWLNPEKSAKIIDSLPAPEISKELLKYKLKGIGGISQNIAHSKLEAYTTAAILNPLESPVDWAKKKGRMDDYGTPKFVEDYEKEVANQQGLGGKLLADYAQGGMKLISTGAGAAALASSYASEGLEFAGFDDGSERADMLTSFAGKVGAEVSKTSQLSNQGIGDTPFYVGKVVEELPSLLAQALTTKGIGAGATAAGFSKVAAGRIGMAGMLTTAGMQSAGMTYSQEIAGGASEEVARSKATKAGLNTALITGFFQKIGLGGAESAMLNKGAAGVAMRDIFAAKSKAEMAKAMGRSGGSIAKGIIGEGLEEGWDEFTAAFLNADPDTNLSDAWANAVEAAKIGAILGGGMATISSIAETPTHLKGLNELERQASAVSKSTAQENLPETETAGRAFPTSGPVSLAEIERERAAQIELTEDPEEKKTLAEATPEELAGEWGVDVAAEESQEPGTTGDSENTIPDEPEELQDTRSYVAKRVSEGLTREEALEELREKRSAFKGLDLPVGTRVLAPNAPGANLDRTGKTSTSGVWEKQVNGKWVLLDDNGDTISTVVQPDLSALAGGKIISSTPQKESQEPGAAVIEGVSGETKSPVAPASGPVGKAEEDAAYAEANAWDMENRGKRSDEWFEGGKANMDAINGYKESLAAGGGQLQAHGMAKESTLSGAIRNLSNLLRNGLDPNRRGGRLDTAALVSGDANASGGATASGAAYSDGPFTLIAKPGGKAGQDLSGDLSNLGAVVINQANAAQAESIKKAILAIRPDLIVGTASELGAITEQLLGKKATTPTATAAVPTASLPEGQAPPAEKAGGVVAVADTKRLNATKFSDTLAGEQRGRRIASPMRDEAGNYETPTGVEVTLTDEGSIAELNGEQYSGDIEIDFIGVSNSENRGKGAASQELDRVLAEADKRDMSVSLVVDSANATNKGAPSGLNDTQLKQWYEKKGFIFDGRVGYRPRKSEDRAKIEPRSTTIKQDEVKGIEDSLNEGTEREFSDPETLFEVFSQDPSKIPTGYLTASDDVVYYYDGKNRPTPVSNAKADYDYKAGKYVVSVTSTAETKPETPAAQKPTQQPEAEAPVKDLRNAPIEDVAKAALENPNDVNAALLVFAAAGVRPASLPGQTTPAATLVQGELFQEAEDEPAITPEKELSQLQKFKATASKADIKLVNQALKLIKEEAAKNPEAVRLRIKFNRDGTPKIAEKLDDEGNVALDKAGNPKREVKFMQEAYKLRKSPKLSKNDTTAVRQAADLLEPDARLALSHPASAKGLGWYARMRDFLQRQFGANIEVFGQLLGATSARTPVDENFKQTLEAMKEFGTGMYDQLLEDYHDFVQQAEKDAASGKLLADWKAKNPDKKENKFDLADELRKRINEFNQFPLRPNGKKFNANSKKVMQAIYGNWIQQTKGPKTPNFAGNLTGRTLKATIDVWAARTLRRLLYEGKGGIKKWRILPQQEKGVEENDFFFGQDVMDQVAQRLGMPADDLQALMWFYEKEIWDRNNWTNTTGKKKSSFDDEAGKLSLDRFQAGVTTFTSADQFSPTDQENQRRNLRQLIAKIPGIRASRVTHSDGLYGDVNEPTLDVEFSVNRNRDGSPQSIKSFVKELLKIGADPKNRQMDVFVSQIVDANHPNARPALEIGFKSPASAREIAAVIKMLQRNGVDGFTVAKDARGNIIGIRAQYIPEISKRFDDSVDHTDPNAFVVTAGAWMQNASKSLSRLAKIPNVSYLEPGFVSTTVYGTEEYGQAKITEPSATSIADELGRRASLNLGQSSSLLNGGQVPSGATPVAAAGPAGDRTESGAVDGDVTEQGDGEVSQRVDTPSNLSKKAADGPQNLNEVRAYVTKNFEKLAKALGVSMFPNLLGYTARYVVTGQQGSNYIEFNPRDFIGMSPAQIYATFREELIHAASNKALQARGQTWVEFYSGLAKLMTPEERAVIKKVYRSARNDVDYGAEYFRMGIQKLLDGNVTEAEARSKAFQKIMELVKDVVDFFRNNNRTKGIYRDVFNDTVKLMQNAGGKKGKQTLYQDSEGPKGTYTPKAVAAAQNVSNTVLGLIEGKSDTTTGIHEAGHAIEDFLREIGESDKADALEAWAKENVGNDWRKKREYIARGFERFVINGVKTGVESVDRAFARIAEIMLNIYKGIKGSSIDIDIPPNIEQIFNDLLSRGAKLEAEGKAPVTLPVDIERQAPKPKAEAKPQAAPAPKRKIPARKMPAVLPFGVKREDLDAARRRYGIPERQGMVVRMTDEESLDEAYARLAKSDKGDESVLVGQKLVLNLMEGNRGSDKVEVALLAIHGFEIQKALKDLETKIGKLDPAETQKRKSYETLQEALLNDFQDLVNITQLQGSRAGLALQAMKLVANEVYSVDAMLRRRAVWKNTGKKAGQAKEPLTPAELKDTEAQSKKILELIKERERLMKELEDKYNREEAAAIITKKEKDVAKEKKPAKPRSALSEKRMSVASSGADRLRAMGLGRVVLEQAAENQTDVAYLAAVEAGDMETAQKMVDDAAQKAGYIKKVYHGTVKKFTDFKSKLSGIWTAYDPANAEPGSGESAGIRMALYADPGKKSVELSESELKEWQGSPNPLRWMRDFIGRQYYVGEKGAVTSVKVGNYALVVTKPSQLKSSDVSTQDKNGNVIPLSQRFNPDSTSTLYQKNEENEDTVYLKLAEDPEKNKAKLLDMVKPAAKRAGYSPSIWYHGSQNLKKIITFKLPDWLPRSARADIPRNRGAFFFSKDAEYAEEYTFNHSPAGARKTKTSGVGEFLLRADRVYDAAGNPEHLELARKWFDQNREYAGKELAEFYDTDTWAPLTDKRLGRMMEAMEEGDWSTFELFPKFQDYIKESFDGYSLKEGLNLQYDTVAVFSPEQIKSADPVTYDEQGNVIPLSQRFNPESPSILYQEEEPSQVEILDALSDVGLGYFANGIKDEKAFTEKLVEEWGEQFRSEASTVFSMAQDKDKKLAATSRQKTPQELASLIDPTKDLSQKMVYNMALGFMRQGLKGDAVLDAVTELLRNDYPNVTREEVVIAFTGYGKILIPSQEQIKKDIRELRTIERLNAQLDDLAKGELPKRTGLQRDKTTPTVRSLMKQVEAAIRDSGLQQNDKKARLAGSLDPIKTRLKNEIADMDQAIKTKTALNKAKKEPKTDAEIEKLKKQRDDMKKSYDAAFGIDRKKISVEAQIKRASAMLDRQIKALEAEARGEILNNPKKVKLDSPELKAKRERLESLREAKRAAMEARNPKKTAAEIATNRLYDSVNKSIERFEYFIRNGTYPPTAKGVAPTLNSVLKDMMATRDRLRDTVREIQKDRRILTPPEVIARRRAVTQLKKTIADLEARIAKRDFSKRAKKPESTDPAVRNLKTTVANLRKTLDQLKKDSLKPISPEEKRIQRMIAASKKRRENYERRLAAGDFAKPVKRDTKEDSRLTQIKIDEAKAKAEWLEEARKYAVANMSRAGKIKYAIKNALIIRKITALGAEFGIAFRQLLFFTYRVFFNPKSVALTFIKAFNATFSRDKEIEYYNDFIDRPYSIYDKRLGLKLISPFADPERMQEMDAVDPEVLEKINSKIPKWVPLRWATEFLLSVERFNRVSTNAARVYFADNMLDKGIRDPGNPTKDELDIIGNAAMVFTGRGNLGKGDLERGVAAMNMVTISARYAVSRAQVTLLQPLWTTSGNLKGTVKLRAHIALDIYGKAIVGRVLTGALVYSIVKALTPDDEEEETVWDPTSSKFGVIYYKGTAIELNGGARPYINLLTQAVLGYKLNSKGKVIPLRGEGSIGFGKQDFRDSLYDFVRNRENINMAMILDTITQKHFGDIPMTPTSFTRQLLEPIIVEDLVNIFEKHGIRDGSVLATALFFGVGVRTPWEKTEKKEPEYNWIRF